MRTLFNVLHKYSDSNIINGEEFMEDIPKKSIIKIIIASIGSIGLIIAFSMPLGMYPPLGGLLFPGDGLWTVPGEVPVHQTLSVAGLSDNVTVLRDEWGIPHIYGSNESDILFALGYCHAEDRLFQMDMARRMTRGQMSEILGESMLETDKYNLAMMKEYWSNETVEYMKNSQDAEVKAIYQKLLKYCDGVNLYIDNNLNNLPLEFQFLGYQPDPWTPVDAVAFSKYMAEMLTWGYQDISQLEMYELLGPENYSTFFQYPMPFQIPICPNYGDWDDISVTGQPLSAEESLPIPSSSGADGNVLVDESVSSTFSSFLKGVEKIPQEKERMENSMNRGSNNWVVNGSKTESGLPILCNDMHLAWSLPGIWYEAHLYNTKDNWSFYGFFLAGVPVPIVGHNNYVGWGFTNTAYDVLDWYYYDKVEGDDSKYMYKGAETSFTTNTYSIPVKGQDPVTFILNQTVHGPVFTSFMDTDDLPEDIANKEIACKWIAQNITFEFQAFYGYSHSKNRSDYNTASSFFGLPAQNHAYADVEGNIAIRPTGKVPVRNDTNIPSGHLGNGTFPYNGSAGHGEWTHYLELNDLPNCENPTQEYLVSANQVIAGPEYFALHDLQRPYATGYRARRIHTLLSQNDDITVEDMMRFQTDVYSTRAGNFTPSLLTALNTITLDATGTAAKTLLSNWDYIMDKSVAAPSIFNVWIEIFKEETFMDEAKALNNTGFANNVRDNILENLTKNDPNSFWFDNVSTTSIEDANDIMILAFNKTVAGLTEFFGTSTVAEWKWGELHFVEIEHLTGLSGLGSDAYPWNGTGYTVTPSGANVWKNGEVQESYSHGGASERLIVDFADMNKSISVIPSGQRGISTSVHYDDQLMMFLKGEYHTQYFGATSSIATVPNGFKTAWIESTIEFLPGGA